MPESNVERTLGIILASVEDIKRRMDQADGSRSEIHQGINGLVLRISHIETDVLSLKTKVSGVEAITDDVKKMRERAFGAGSLGVWLWRIGGGILSFAGGLAAAYTWLTGRPPP